MMDINVELHKLRQQELQYEAEKSRNGRDIPVASNGLARQMRHSLGRALVNIGQQLADE